MKSYGSSISCYTANYVYNYASRKLPILFYKLARTKIVSAIVEFFSIVRIYLNPQTTIISGSGPPIKG